MPRSVVPCLYCGAPFVFLTGKHLRREDHFDGDDVFDRYKEWVAEEHDIDPDHEVFETPGALTRPEHFEEYEHLFR